jgi:hypothetical protein
VHPVYKLTLQFVYGVIYLLFEAFPFVFTIPHHMNAGVSGLMFLPLPIGGALAVTCVSNLIHYLYVYLIALYFPQYILIFNPRYERAVASHAPRPVPPEFRLEMAIIAAPLFAIAFFWFAWTSFPSIPFAIPMLSVLLMGFSICWIFVSTSNLLQHSYMLLIMLIPKSFLYSTI